MRTPDQFYLGKTASQNPPSGSSAVPLLYDPADLTTHAIIVGMTGSGKTGLLITLLEEAALKGIPAIIIDPKGDLTNLCLHFPNLLPSDFQPWIDPEAARRLGKPVDVIAAEVSARWKTGLAEDKLGFQELQALADVDYHVYTPGSSAGEPINLLASFEKPGKDWNTHREALREQIASLVTALLGLVGLQNIDPLRSREHILLANIFERAWSQNHSLDLTELIMQVQSPPFDRLGAFVVDSFFPEKNRRDLAVLLNNFLVSPTFQSWMEGAHLDIPQLLVGQDGRVRHSIFYIAHLNDNERMFFVTLLLAAVEGWMRTQRGTGSLRAILAFDEISGYLPPIANPPARPVLMRMLKQARAFGLGLILATQNPVDLDYKALSNAGTWMIGRLQTEKDRERLLDGLQSASSTIDLPDANRLISALRQRMFVLSNAHKPGLQLFQTRWTLNFLAGPLTRAQIPELKNLLSSSLDTQPIFVASLRTEAATPAVRSTSIKNTEGKNANPILNIPAVETTSHTRPAVPTGIAEYFLPDDLGISQASARLGKALRGPVELAGVLYKPALLIQAEVRYPEKRGVPSHTRRVTLLMPELIGSRPDWEDYPWLDLDSQRVDNNLPIPQARYAPLPGWMRTAANFNNLQKDFIDWLIRTGEIKAWSNPTLKLSAGSDMTEAGFFELCSEAARQAYKTEQVKIERGYSTRKETLLRRLEKQKLAVDLLEEKVGKRKQEQFGVGAEFVAGLFSKRKRSISAPLSRSRMVQEAQGQLDRAKQEFASLKDQLKALDVQLKQDLDAAKLRWGESVNDIVETVLTPTRKGIYLELFGVAWLPHYLLKSEGQIQEIPAFRSPKDDYQVR
ncbi:MAG TPA: DUF87 domain-containing protein [Anaerolineaceae bacterium]